MTAFSNYLALVQRMSIADINRSENDLSSNLKTALSEFGLHGVLDTGAGANLRKRPDIALYCSLDAADAGTAADVLVESKKPHEVAQFSSLRDALVDDDLWNGKLYPYVAAHLERISYFILTTFESFLIVPISDKLRREFLIPNKFAAPKARADAVANGKIFDVRTTKGGRDLFDWCGGHLTPVAIKPPKLSSILDLRQLSDADELEVFANELADVVVGPEERPTPGGALLSSVHLEAAALDDLPPKTRSALTIYTMSAHGGMSVEDATEHLKHNLDAELSEFLGASIHSLVGRLFAVKTIEDAFCIDVSPPLLPSDSWVFHSKRFDSVSDERLPDTLFDALGALDHSDNAAVRDLAATGRFYDWLAPQMDPAAFRRLLTPFFAHNFRDLDGDLLGRFFEIYAQRLDRQRRRDLGQYYTPTAIVRFMWEASINLAREREALQEMYVLDPGVGSGTFLLEGARRLQAAGLKRFWDRLHGFDIAPQVIGVAQVNLYLTVLGLLDRTEAEQVGVLKLYPTDALDPRNGAKLKSILPLLTDESTRHFLERRIEMSEEIKQKSQFTLVIGNPPYKNNSSRTLAQIAEVFPPLLRSSRENARARERNIRDDYAWFFAAADHYTIGGGVISFVVSDSFCYAPSYRFFREDMLRRYHVRHCVHLGRFIFRDVGPRTSFVIVVLERRNAELTDAAKSEQIPYCDMRGLAANFEGGLGGVADPRLIALNNGVVPEPEMHVPERRRDFRLFPSGDAVQRVLRTPIILHGATPRRVFIKKWPGIITAFDKLFKASDSDAVVHRLKSFFEIALQDSSDRTHRLEELGSTLRMTEEELPRLVALANQAVQKSISFSVDNVRRALTGSSPNSDAWYPSDRMTSWLYYEPNLVVPRNINPGRDAGWGSMSQWREPESHSLLPKLAFTTSANPQAGLKAFVLNDDWIVKLAAGTRQQLNYTGVNNPLAPDNLSGPNNLGSEALELYAALEAGGMGDEDFLLYIAGIYNSQLAADYLEQGGANMLNIPVDPARLDLDLVVRIIQTSRQMRDTQRLQAKLVETTDLDEVEALSLVTEARLQELSFVRAKTGSGRFKQRTSWQATEATTQKLTNDLGQLGDALDADVDALYG